MTSEAVVKNRRMSFTDFEEYEKKCQQEYDDIKLSFKPTMVVSVKLLRFRNVSVGKIADFFDTPDPEFEVSCPKVEKESVRSFKTKNIKDNVTSGEINDEYRFIIPEDFPPDEEFPVNIKLTDRDLVFDDVIGMQTIDAKQLKSDGVPLKMTLTFGKKNGELEFEIKKSKETRPDFRYGFGLCREEREYRKKRIPLVHQAMNKLLGNKGPENLLETPIVSLVGSGGGYRAVIGMCGAMEALTDAGITDITTYHSALSGGAWYLSAAYALQTCSSANQKQFHDDLRSRMSENILWDFISLSTIGSYRNFANNFLDHYSLPKTLVNYFPGYLVTKQLFGLDKLDVKLSDIAPYVDTGEVPYPLIAAIQVKNKVAANKFHAYTETSPHEICIPSHGIGVSPENGGSVWSNGFLVRKTPEYPLHFTVGMTGCAFSILLNQFFLYGNEAGNSLFSKLDEIRIEDRKKAKTDLDASGRVAEIESDEETDDEDDEETDTETDSNLSTPTSVLGSISGYNLAPEGLSAIEQAAKAAYECSYSPVSPGAIANLSAIAKVIRRLDIFSSRDHLVGRTAKLRNFLLNCKQEKRFLLDPRVDGYVTGLESSQMEIIGAAGYKWPSNSMTVASNNTNLSFVDAGIMKNVPTDAVLRPQRGTDVMIVLDFSACETDDNFSYQALLAAAAHSWQSGLKFPKINLKEILKLPPKEFLIFPSDADDCPTVLWFTLSNKSFKDVKDYVPRSNIKKPKSQHQPFNKFHVFGKDSEYSTFQFGYDSYKFDQLRELMYHNVTIHIEEIKQAVAEAVERRRRKLER